MKKNMENMIEGQVEDIRKVQRRLGPYNRFNPTLLWVLRYFAFFL